jgi:hypothetical protein
LASKLNINLSRKKDTLKFFVIEWGKTMLVLQGEKQAFSAKIVIF